MYTLGGNGKIAPAVRHLQTRRREAARPSRSEAFCMSALLAHISQRLLDRAKDHKNLGIWHAHPNAKGTIGRVIQGLGLHIGDDVVSQC